jgi:hypothetical protein
MNNSPAYIPEDENFDLKLKINVVKAEIEKVKNELNEFEAILRNFVLDDMIEEQELAAKYRNFQKEKKNKRLAQKKKGKNYQEPKGLKVVQNEKVQEESQESKLERKQLYRETMLRIHPDRVGNSMEDKSRATELTIKLVEIYSSGNRKELELFCAHVQSEEDKESSVLMDTKIENSATVVYFENELANLELNLAKLKSKHTYEVLSTYERPIDFAQELKDFYKDRIEKLKKRTRKVK